jgi:hypothetical protein
MHWNKQQSSFTSTWQSKIKRDEIAFFSFMGSRTHHSTGTARIVKRSPFYFSRYLLLTSSQNVLFYEASSLPFHFHSSQIEYLYNSPKIICHLTLRFYALVGWREFIFKLCSSFCRKTQSHPIKLNHSTTFYTPVKA